jgi:hypothetical protein
MSWRTLTETDLAGHLSDTELQRIRATATGDRPDPIADTLRGITDTVRGYISGHAANRLGPDGTLPTELVNAACAIATVQVWIRVGGGLIDPKGLRKQAADDAQTLLRDVSKGLFRVQPPPTADAQAPGSGGADAELISGTGNYPVSTELNGLF